MKAELKLNIDKDLLVNAEQYAKEEGQNLSDIVARYLKALCEWQPPAREDIDPEIEALIGIGGQLEDEENVDYKELLADAMSEKHLK